MMASRGMGAIAPSKMPGAKKKARRDDTDFDEYAEGGKVKKMAEGDLVKDFEVKPTSLTLDKDYKGASANVSGNIPLSDREKIALSADLSAGKAKGQKLRGNLDNVMAEYKRQIDKDTDIGASISRGPSGSSRYGVSYKRQIDKDTDIDASISRGSSGSSQYGVSYNKRFKEGGKSKVNEAGVYTKPGMRKSLFESIKSRAVQGTGAGQWSARKAQLLAKQYKAKGGGYK